MNVKQFCQQRVTREFFRNNITKPRKQLSEIIVNSNSHNPQLVGTAVDIGIKVFVGNRDHVLKMIDQYIKLLECFHLFENPLFHRCLDIRDKIQRGKRPRTKDISISSAFMALIEQFQRSGYIDTSELNDGLTLIEPEVNAILENFRTKGPELSSYNICPSFETQFGLIGDGDLINREILLDIKTSAQRGIKRDDFNQLAMYFIMAKQMDMYNSLESFGFYYTRQNCLILYDPQNVFQQSPSQLINRLEEIYFQEVVTV